MMAKRAWMARRARDISSIMAGRVGVCRGREDGVGRYEVLL